MVSDREFALLQEEVRNLRRRMENMLSRAGGYVQGNIAFTGNLKPDRSGTQYSGYVFVPLSAAATSTQWDGVAKTTGDNGTIDLSVEFGLPPGIKAVSVSMVFIDETVDVHVRLRRPGSTDDGITQFTQVANQEVAANGIVPCSNGDIWFWCSAELDAVTIYITGYFI